MKFRKDIRGSINFFSKVALFFLVVLMTPAFLMAQNRKELEEKRKELVKEIELTTNMLHETQKNKAVMMDRYFALQSQIQKRQQLIATLQQELDYSNNSIVRANEVINALNEDLERLQAEYAAMMRTAYRMKVNNSSLLFLFSADNLNDFFKRWQYIRQHNKYRTKQVRLIAETQKTLTEKAEELEKTKAEKEQLIRKTQSQKSLLNKELADKDVMLQSLKTDESRLLAELNKQQEAHSKLNEAIEEVIKTEMAKRKKEARSAEALTASVPSESSASSDVGDFDSNKGDLPWPVSKGTITRQFGTQPHPTLKTIEIANNGIDIHTNNKAEVFAVFRGIVAGTQFIPGYQNIIILQHGKYYTVYSNLEELYVKRGDQVRSKQAIGRLSSNKPEVHFEIWREKQRLNPVNWIIQQ